MTSYSTGDKKLDDAVYAKVKEAVGSIKSIEEFKIAFGLVKKRTDKDNSGMKADPMSAALKDIYDAMQKKFDNSGSNPDIQDLLREGQ